MASRQPLPSADVLNALFDRLIVSVLLAHNYTY